MLEQRLPHAFPVGLRIRIGRAGVAGATLDEQVAMRLWAALAERRITYTAPAWHPAEGQRVRDPEWLWRGRGSGTCLDLALLLAAACLNEGLDTSLVLLRGRVAAHAAVAVRLGSAPGAGDLPPGVAETSSEGVGVVVDPASLLDDPELLLLDPTTATADSPDRSARYSAGELAEHISGGMFPHVHLVDVTVCQQQGDHPLDRPRRVGALRGHIARPLLREVRSFPSREQARARMREHRTRAVVLHGPEGSGKSTLARQFAIEADDGFGWFLSGAGRGSYLASLARAELAERGTQLTELDPLIEKELADAALDRLEAGGDWVVVLDNVDLDPKKLGRLPEPRDGQLLVVTTTGDPALWPGSDAVALAPLDVADLADEHVIGTLGRVAAGSPLLLSAYAALQDSHPEVAADLAEATVTDIDEGAALYWSTLRARLPTCAPLAERLALLPPDMITNSVAEELAPGKLDELSCAGLVTALTDATVSLHRVFGRAIRADAAARGTAAEAAAAVLDSSAAFAALTRWGDPEITGRIAHALSDHVDGLALARLGALQEVHDGLAASLATYARAEELLAALLPKPGSSEAGALADCYHAKGREANQLRKDLLTGEILKHALAAVAMAAGLRGPNEAVERAKHQALSALLRQRAASGMARGAERTVEYERIAAELDASWQSRRAVLGDDHPLVDRALFNRAGVRIQLAQAQPDRAAEHLAVARDVYLRTLDFRRRTYAELSPLTAASENGLGTWGYYGLLLGVAPDPRSTFEEAVQHTSEALRIRLRGTKKDDIVKSAAVLAKLGLLRAHQSGGDTPAIAANALDELHPCADFDD
ncbi:MAG: AAA family ATPase [Microbacteriaceae bacterium]